MNADKINKKWCKSLVYGSQLQLENGVAGTIQSPIGHPLASFSGTMTAILGAAGNGTPTEATWSIKFDQDFIHHFERGFLVIGCLHYFGGLHSTTCNARAEISLNHQVIDGFNLRIIPPDHSDYFHRIPTPTLPDMSPFSDCRTTYAWPILKEKLVLSEYQTVSITIDSNTWWDIDYVGFLFCTDRVEVSVVHWFKKIWNDPVWSKVIAALIITACTAVVAKLGYVWWFSERKPQSIDKSTFPQGTSRTEQRTARDKKTETNIDHPNYDPIVLIKSDTPPSPNEALDPYKHFFVLTNSGKSPARNVRIIVYESSGNGIPSNDKMTAFGHNATQQVERLNGVSIYQGNDMPFQIPSTHMTGNKYIEVTFIITYKVDGITNDKKVIQKFINTPDTNQHWIYVANDYYLFKEPLRIPLEFGNGNISKTNIQFVENIVDNILGVDFVSNANSNRLSRAFAKVSDEIRKNGGWDKTFTISDGALTGLRSDNIIDNHDKLTKYGVTVFHKVASHLKSGDNPKLLTNLNHSK